MLTCNVWQKGLRVKQGYYLLRICAASFLAVIACYTIAWERDCQGYKILIQSSSQGILDHFTVVGLVSWLLNGSEAGVDLVLIDPAAFIVQSLHLHEKSREVCIKARSPPASLAFMAR